MNRRLVLAVAAIVTLMSAACGTSSLTNTSSGSIVSPPQSNRVPTIPNGTARATATTECDGISDGYLTVGDEWHAPWVLSNDAGVLFVRQEGSASGGPTRPTASLARDTMFRVDGVDSTVLFGLTESNSTVRFSDGTLPMFRSGPSAGPCKLVAAAIRPGDPPPVLISNSGREKSVEVERFAPLDLRSG